MCYLCTDIDLYVVFDKLIKKTVKCSTLNSIKKRFATYTKHGNEEEGSFLCCCLMCSI